jgi:hypothetical protein
MCVTIGVVALATSLVLPRLVGRGPGGLEAATNDLVQRLTTARWRAVVEGRAVTVPLDHLAPGITLTAAPPPGAVSADDVAAGLTMPPLPAALPRVLVLRDAGGSQAHITVPAGLAAIAVIYEDRS